MSGNLAAEIGKTIKDLPKEKLEEMAKTESPQQDSAPNSFLSPKGDVGKAMNFKPISAADILSRPTEEIPWIWDTYIAEGNLFLLVAYMKVGKSTLAYPLALSIARGENFLDRETKQGSVLILALEEHPRDVANRLKGLGMNENDPVFVHEGFLPNSPKELESVKAFIQKKEITLVLVDSLSVFWNVKDENDNAAVVREVKPLLALARDTETAICLVHHDSKSGGPGGRNIRGGSSLFGLVDQAIMLEHLPGEKTNKRVLKTLGRYAESPSELVIELVNNEYRVIGTREEVGKQAIMDEVSDSLTNELQDVKAIAQEIDKTQKATRQALEELRQDGRAVREGEGVKGKPYTYRLPEEKGKKNPDAPPEEKEKENAGTSDSFLSQYPSIGNESNLEQSGDEKVWTQEY